MTCTNCSSNREKPDLALILGGGFVAVMLIAFGVASIGGTDNRGSGAASLARQQDERQQRTAREATADSAQVVALLALPALSLDSALLADRIIHRWSFPLAHDEVHRLAISATLDSAAAVLERKALDGGEPRAARWLLDGIDSTTATDAQRERAARLRRQADRDEARSRAAAEERAAADRVASVKREAGCKVSDAKARRLIRAHSGWTDSDLGTVACGRIRIGFTAEQVRVGWGRPSDINRTIAAYGVHEQWVYGEYGERGFVYLEDGVVTTIQN